MPGTALIQALTWLAVTLQTTPNVLFCRAWPLPFQPWFSLHLTASFSSVGLFQLLKQTSILFHAASDSVLPLHGTLCPHPLPKFCSSFRSVPISLPLENWALKLEGILVSFSCKFPYKAYFFPTSCTGSQLSEHQVLWNCRPDLDQDLACRCTLAVGSRGGGEVALLWL